MLGLAAHPVPQSLPPSERQVVCRASEPPFSPWRSANRRLASLATSSREAQGFHSSFFCEILPAPFRLLHFLLDALCSYRLERQGFSQRYPLPFFFSVQNNLRNPGFKEFHPFLNFSKPGNSTSLHSVSFFERAMQVTTFFRPNAAEIARVLFA